MLWLALLVLAQQTAPPRDATAARPAPTAIVRGTITSAVTRQPLHRVRVTLNTADANPPSAVTDTRGNFEITGVPAGAFSLTAARAGYLTVQYGQRRPGEAGRRIEIKDAEVVAGIDIALYRGGVISGRVLDEAGDAYAGARVEAIDLRYIRGRRVPVPVRVTSSNDAGEYRLSGLEPGTYQVRAWTTDVWEAEDGKSTFVHAVTYFPGVTGAQRPEALTVAMGQEIASTDVRLIPGPAATIAGVVRDANGEPMAGQVVHLDRITRTTGGALMSAGFGGTAKTDANGMFEFPKLAAGEYNAITGGPNDTVMNAAVVSDGETKSIVLTPRPAPRVAGAIVSDDGTPLPVPSARLDIEPVSVDPRSVLPAWGEARSQSPAPDGKFRLAGLDGSYLFRITGLPDDWMLASVTFGDRDLTDTPLTVARGGPDVTGLQIVVTRKGATLDGQVIDSKGTAAADATVIVFVNDSTKWGLASRFVKAVRPSASAHFVVAGLPPGRYLAVARDYASDGQWTDPEFLQSLVKSAVPVELTAGDTVTVKLRLEDAR